MACPSFRLCSALNSTSSESIDTQELLIFASLSVNNDSDFLCFDSTHPTTQDFEDDRKIAFLEAKLNLLAERSKHAKEFSVPQHSKNSIGSGQIKHLEEKLCLRKQPLFPQLDHHASQQNGEQCAIKSLQLDNIHGNLKSVEDTRSNHGSTGAAMVVSTCPWSNQDFEDEGKIAFLAPSLKLRAERSNSISKGSGQTKKLEEKLCPQNQSLFQQLDNHASQRNVEQSAVNAQGKLKTIQDVKEPSKPRDYEEADANGTENLQTHYELEKEAPKECKYYPTVEVVHQTNNHNGNGVTPPLSSCKIQAYKLTSTEDGWKSSKSCHMKRSRDIVDDDTKVQHIKTGPSGYATVFLQDQQGSNKENFAQSKARQVRKTQKPLGDVTNVRNCGHPRRQKCKDDTLECYKVEDSIINGALMQENVVDAPGNWTCPRERKKIMKGPRQRVLDKWLAGKK